MKNTIKKLLGNYEGLIQSQENITLGVVMFQNN